MAAYLEACLEEANGDAAFIAKALGDIARAKVMTQVARDAGLFREPAPLKHSFGSMPSELRLFTNHRKAYATSSMIRSPAHHRTTNHSP